MKNSALPGAPKVPNADIASGYKGLKWEFVIIKAAINFRNSIAMILSFIVKLFYFDWNRIIWAGTPPTTALSGISLVITEFAPTMTLFPIVTGPKILESSPK